MGEAKKRGNIDQRAAEAKQNKIDANFIIIKKVNHPVDEELFLYCFDMFHAAANMSMPVENPENTKVEIDEIGTVAFTDNSLNRGLLAVSAELREQGVSDEVAHSLMMRLMQFNDVLKNKEKFGTRIIQSNVDGSIDISEELIRACATAKFLFVEDSLIFDLDDIELQTIKIEERSEAIGNAKINSVE